MDILEIPPSSLDRNLSLLANQQRRLVLRYLKREPSIAVAVDDLVSYIVDNATADHNDNRDIVRTKLHHHTLPKLESHGLIDYDWRSRAVHYHSNDRIETLLECLPDG